MATKRVTASHIDELGLSVLIKSCDRLGDAEWAVMILKEVVKAGEYTSVHTTVTSHIHTFVTLPSHIHTPLSSHYRHIYTHHSQTTITVTHPFNRMITPYWVGLHVKFKYYQRVFAILVKSPNAAQLAVEMLLHIEKTAALNKMKAVVPMPAGAASKGVSSRTMGDLAAAAAADERDQKATALMSPRGGWGAMTTTPVPEGGESERDRYLRELLDTLSNPYAVENEEEDDLDGDLSLSEFYQDGDEMNDEDDDEWATHSLVAPPSPGYNNNNHNNNHNEVLRGGGGGGGGGGGRSSKHEAFADTLRDLLSFETPPMADPCIYAAVISSLSHNRMAKEACALLRSYVSRG